MGDTLDMSFVRKIKSNKGVKEVGKFGIERIDVNGDMADLYTAGGNVYTVKCRKVIDEDKVVTNSKNYHKNLF